MAQLNFAELRSASKARGRKLVDTSWYKAFVGLAGNVLDDGAITWKEKEMIAIALAQQAHCEDCIIAHVQNAIDAGVTREELVDVLGVCTLMGGGPGLSHSGLVLEAYDQFKAEAAAK